MRAGRLRHRVTLQEFVEIVDEYGTPIGSGWQDVATVWATVEPIKGEEYILVQNTQAELTARIIIRYLAGIKPSMRVLYGDRKFDIKSVIDPEERHRWLTLMCVERIE